MSNVIVGDLYQEIINGVISEARLDFEDRGVDESILQELKKIWQQKLTSLRVAQFPWDAQSDSAPSTSASASSTAAASREDKKNAASSSAASGSASHNGVRIKREDTETSASQNGGLVLPGGGRIAQTDGSFDIDALTSSEPASSIPPSANLDSLTTRDVDRIIASSILKERQRLQSSTMPAEMEIELEIPPHLLRKLRQQQVDGAGDDDSEDDSDEINSDLDDPDDDPDSGREDDHSESTMMMLCLYDKVQRVKNKWKYVLKDGVANINGKDYVFNRANVESEW